MLKRNLTYRRDKTKHGDDIIIVSACGEDFHFRMKDHHYDKVESIKFNLGWQEFETNNLAISSLVRILAYIVPCRELRHIVDALTKFVFVDTEKEQMLFATPDGFGSR